MKVIVLYEKSWKNESPSLFIINPLMSLRQYPEPS